jgi:hypothetical protein
LDFFVVRFAGLLVVFFSLVFFFKLSSNALTNSGQFKLVLLSHYNKKKEE